MLFLHNLVNYPIKQGISINELKTYEIGKKPTVKYLQILFMTIYPKEKNSSVTILVPKKISS